MACEQALGTRRDAGFTLLEVLVAFVIAAMALAVLFSGALDGLRSARLSAHYQEALSRAQSRLAAIGHGGPLADADQQGDDGGGFHWRTRVTTVATAPLSDQSGPQAPRVALHDVQVIVSWDLDGGTRQVALTTQRAGLAPARAP